MGNASPVVSIRKFSRNPVTTLDHSPDLHKPALTAAKLVKKVQTVPAQNVDPP